MILTLKLTASVIQRKLNLKTVNKLKEITFELNKINEEYHQESYSNKSRKTKNLKPLKIS